MKFENRYVEKYWNNLIASEPSGKVRNYVRASEFGNPMCDRYLSMMGVVPTNYYSNRTLRIFDAGNMVEWLVIKVLELSGLLNRNQGWLEMPATKDTLRVVGKLDATIGGFTSWEDLDARVLAAVEKYRNLGMDSDDLIGTRALSLVQGLKEDYPDGWPEEMVVEVKSISSMAFWNSKGNKNDSGYFVGYPNNRLQLYAYLKMAKLRQGMLLYVSKDDLTLAEVPVSIEDATLSDKLSQDLERITYYYRRKEAPDKEPIVIFNPQRGVFELNWAVTRSLYLKMLYDYEDEADLRQSYHQHMLDVNRALKHLKAGKVKTEDLELIVSYDMEKLLENVDA